MDSFKFNNQKRTESNNFTSCPLFLCYILNKLSIDFFEFTLLLQLGLNVIYYFNYKYFSNSCSDTPSSSHAYSFVIAPLFTKFIIVLNFPSSLPCSIPR